MYQSPAHRAAGHPEVPVILPAPQDIPPVHPPVPLPAHPPVPVLLPVPAPVPAPLPDGQDAPSKTFSGTVSTAAE